MPWQCSIRRQWRRIQTLIIFICLARTNARPQQQEAMRSNALILVTTLPLRFCGWPHLLGKICCCQSIAHCHCHSHCCCCYFCYCYCSIHCYCYCHCFFCSWPSGAINICDSEMQLRGNNEYSGSDCSLWCLPPLSACHPASTLHIRQLTMMMCTYFLSSPPCFLCCKSGDSEVSGAHLSVAFFYNIFAALLVALTPSISRSDTLATFLANLCAPRGEFNAGHHKILKLTTNPG